MDKKRLALFGKDRPTSEYLQRTLEYLFEGVVEVIPYFMEYEKESLPEADITIPVVITTYSSFFNDARIIFPNSKIINGEKMLTGFNMENIIMLPAGKKVLLVAKPKAVALETIENLLEFGMNHLEYIPFVPGDPIPPDVDTVISPGLLHYCPPELTNCIDIGCRQFSIDTYSKLLQELELDSHYLDKITPQFKLPLVLSNNKLAENMEKMKLYNQECELIINKIPDAILLASNDRSIIFLNKEMAGVIRKTKDQLIGQKTSEVIEPISNKEDLFYNLDPDVSAKIEINGREYIYSLTTMQQGKNKHYIFTFKLAKKTNANQINWQKYGHIAKYTFDDFWGESEKTLNLKARALSFAKNDMTILIYGESGTGKEILAQAMHNASFRKDAPFVAINFAAIPENLIEAELFGYEGGAFTGAKKEGKPGYFEIATGGTIFIDEIGDMPMFLQSRLLRVLQEREVIRVGGSHIIPVNVRIIAATNVDLKQQVINGKFRQDLYFRLNVLSLSPAPLREFKNNISNIARKYLRRKYAFTAMFSEEVESVLALYDWPGNVRELFNTSDFIFHSSEGKQDIDMNNIPPYIIQEVKTKLVLPEESIKSNHSIFTREEIYSAILDMLFTGKEKNNGNNFILNALSVLPEKKPECLSSTSPVFTREEIYCAILDVLLAKKEKTIGRNSILKILKNRGIDITEHYLKIQMGEMKKADLIQAGSTRQGTRVTEKGRLFVYNNKQTF